MKDGDYKGELVRDQVERWMEENPLKYGDGGHGADPRIRDTNRRRRRIPARQRASSIGSDFNIEEEEEEDEIPDDNDLDYLGGNFENANPDDGLGTVGETTLINEDEEGDAPPPAKRPKKRFVDVPSATTSRSSLTIMFASENSYQKTTRTNLKSRKRNCANGNVLQRGHQRKPHW